MRLEQTERLGIPDVQAGHHEGWRGVQGVDPFDTPGTETVLDLAEHLPADPRPPPAMIDGEATVKTFKRTPEKVWLLPHNPAYSPIDGDHARILGRVVSVLRTL